LPVFWLPRQVFAWKFSRYRFETIGCAFCFRLFNRFSVFARVDTVSNLLSGFVALVSGFF
jgi:hypothetical protein